MPAAELPSCFNAGILGPGAALRAGGCPQGRGGPSRAQPRHPLPGAGSCAASAVSRQRPRRRAEHHGRCSSGGGEGGAAPTMIYRGFCVGLGLFLEKEDTFQADFSKNKRKTYLTPQTLRVFKYFLKYSHARTRLK